MMRGRPVKCPLCGAVATTRKDDHYATRYHTGCPNPQCRMGSRPGKGKGDSVRAWNEFVAGISEDVKDGLFRA